jgi:Mn2+/Fe2+ NRAMP family transporter
MRFGKLIILAVTVMVPTLAWAGTSIARPGATATPVLGDAGLIALGVGLLGAGVALLRKR